MARLDSRRYGSPPSSAELHDSIFLADGNKWEDTVPKATTNDALPWIFCYLTSFIVYIWPQSHQKVRTDEKIVGVKIKLFFLHEKNYVLYWNFDEKSWFAHFFTHFTCEKILQIHFSLQNFSVVNNFTYHFLSRIACSV